MSNPTILDDVRRADAYALATHGLGRGMIAKYMGCDLETIENTARLDPDFDQKLRAAGYKFVCRNIELIQRHAAQSSKNSTWLLERLYPEDFARRSPHSITPARLARHFQIWTKALIAAAPPEARPALSQSAPQLAAAQLARYFPADDLGAPDLHDPPGGATGVPPVPADGVSNVPTMSAGGATGVPPVPAGEKGPSLARPANVRATAAPPEQSDPTPHRGPDGPRSPSVSNSPPLRTPSSALPASSPATVLSVALLLLSLLFVGGPAAPVSPGLRPCRYPHFVILRSYCFAGGGLTC